MIARIREALRRWLGVDDGHVQRARLEMLKDVEGRSRQMTRMIAEAHNLLQLIDRRAAMAEFYYSKSLPLENLRVLSERLDALQQALGVQVVAAPAGTGAEASITPVDTTAMKEHRRVMDAEVLLHALRRMTIRAMRDVAEIERLRDRARVIHKAGDNPQ